MRKMVLIPSTFTGEKKDKKIRIFLISQLARVFVTFGINEIGIYYDPDPKFDSHGLGRFILKVLKYLNTPPYLRKIAFPIDKELREIGVSLPLNVEYHHKRDRYVYVYILKKKGNIFLVTDGKRKFYVNSDKKIGKNRILIYDKEKMDFVRSWETKEYFGYEVFYFNKPIHILLEKLKKEGFYLIGTSKLGEDIRKIKLEKRDKIAIAFGSFARGFEDVYKNFREMFDIVINVVPNQLVKTIRTEEAIFYTLAILRYLSVI